VKWFKFSISELALFLVLVAIDFAFVRWAFAPSAKGLVVPSFKTYGMVVLPTANLLILGLLRTTRNHTASSRFLVGFETVGWLAIGGYAICTWLLLVPTSIYFSTVFGKVYNLLAEHSDLGNKLGSELYMWLFMMPAVCCVLSAPLTIAAIGGGLAWHRMGRTDPSPGSPARENSGR
jgi:hypothetical protein